LDTRTATVSVSVSVDNAGLRRMRIERNEIIVRRNQELTRMVAAHTQTVGRFLEKCRSRAAS